MAKKLNPTLDALFMGAALFVILIFVVVFLALLVESVAQDPAADDPARVEQSVRKIGEVYPRRDSDS